MRLEQLLKCPSDSASSDVRGLLEAHRPPWKIGRETAGSCTIIDRDGLEVATVMWIGHSAMGMVNWIVAWTNAVADAERENRKG